MITPYTNLDALEQKLRNNVEALAYKLAGSTKIVKRRDGFRIGRHESLHIGFDGQWFSFETNKGSKSLVSLIRFVMDSSWEEAFAWASAYVENAHGSTQPRKPNPQAAIEKKSRYAYKLYCDAGSIENTLGEDYLYGVRKIRRIAPSVKEKIRFSPRLKHLNGASYPALLFPLTTPDAEWAGILRIYLNPRTANKIKESPKLLLGKANGSAIRLTNAARKMIVCEGVEDALAILYACPDESIWCGVGGNLASIEIPRFVSEVVIAADNDDAGYKIALRLALRLLNERRRKVIIAKPSEFKDFNEVLGI